VREQRKKENNKQRKGDPKVIDRMGVALSLKLHEVYLIRFQVYQSSQKKLKSEIEFDKGKQETEERKGQRVGFENKSNRTTCRCTLQERNKGEQSAPSFDSVEILILERIILAQTRFEFGELTEANQSEDGSHH